MLIRELTTQEVVFALVIAGGSALLAWLFYAILRHQVRRMVGKTETVLDNMLIEALEWPIFAGIVVLGSYFAIIYLPFETSVDFEIRQIFHVAFFALGAWLLAALLDSLFRWFKVEVASKTQTPLDDWIIVLLRVFTPLILAFATVVASLQLYEINISAIKGWLISHGIRIGVIGLLSMFGLFFLSRALPGAIKTIVARGMPAEPDEIKKRADTLSSVLVTTGQVFILVIGGFMILSELGADIAPILAGVGVAGIAIGFGAQSLVKDLLSGLLIIMENQYRVGDVVTIAGISGLVEQINLRRTVLRDMDGVVHVISNGDIRIASNFTKEVSRVNLDITVGYGEDLDRVTSVINRVCGEIACDPRWTPMIVKTPQVLRVEKLGESGIDLKIVGETRPMTQWDVASEIRRRVKKAFDEEGIEIPWPHTKVYFGNSPFLNVPPTGQGESDKKRL